MKSVLKRCTCTCKCITQAYPIPPRMASQSQEPHLHFVLFPMMAQGHMIPMIDMARILANRNIIITIVTTPQNAARFSPILARSIDSGLQIRLVQLPLPCEEAGIPDGCENIDMLPSLGMAVSFFEAINMLEEAVEKVFEELTPRPSCIISDMCLPYTSHIAAKFNIPRISFWGVNCLLLLCWHNLHSSKVLDNITTESESFVILIPGLPDQIEMTKAQVSNVSNDEGWKRFNNTIIAAEMSSYGTIMNSFEELEPAYAREYKRILKDKLWCIGPVSLSNKDHLDKAQRGNNTCTNDHQCIKWLDLQKPKSVLYACLGSVCNLTSSHLIQLGLALEASNRPFIWVVRDGSETEDLKTWIREDGFEERTKARGVVIVGWAPQVLILSHPAIGGFITHCGWNSTIEAICEGVPMVTWPLFGDQFCNEKLIVQILKVGVTVGVKSPMKWGEEKKIGVVVKKEEIERAIEELMSDTKEGEERRKRVNELARMAKSAVEEGGSSHSNVTLFIQDIIKHTNKE